MELHTWLIYTTAVIGLSLSPGPNGLLALTHGAIYGHHKAIYTVTGGVSGFVVVIACSMSGIGALLQTSTNALVLLKWLGGAYLIWLGIQLWRAPAIHLDTRGMKAECSGWMLFRQGALSAITNPKVLLFFGAFLPQFINPRSDLLPQFVVMALTFAISEFLVEYFLARTAHRIRPLLERRGRRFNQLCGGLFVTIGAALPLTR